MSVSERGVAPTNWGLFELAAPRTQGLMTLEGMDIVLKPWQEEAPFEYKGDDWHVKMDQKAPPLLAMSIVKWTSLAAKTAGEKGFIPISINMAPPHETKQQWKLHCEGAAEAGRPDPDRSIWRIYRSLCVAESEEEAREHALNSSPTAHAPNRWCMCAVCSRLIGHLTCPNGTLICRRMRLTLSTS